MLRDEWIWIDRNPLLHDGSMSEPSGHPYSTLELYRFVTQDVRIEEETLAPELLHFGECATARFRWSGDTEIAHRHAIHATILRALSYDYSNTDLPQTPQQYNVISYPRFLSGDADHRGLKYALYHGPYSPSRGTDTRNHLGETEAWLAQLLGVVMIQSPTNPYSITGNATACVDELEFREWTTDGYAGWFGPGREWWGTFLWTIAWPAHGILVGITASSTD